MTSNVLALSFESPALLIGLAAAAIPVVLHLMASVRAPQVAFPSLRFLAAAMERTARRRRVQHWLLLILRSLVLGLLAVAAAEPITRALSLWGPSHAAVVIIDTSGSMAASDSRGARFDRARDAARAILSGDRRPGQAALLTTTGAVDTAALTTDLAKLRTELARLRPVAQVGSIAERLRQAERLLATSPADSRTIWIITDLQHHDVADLLESAAWANLSGSSIGIVTTGQEAVDNVGIVDLSITGRRVAGGRVEIRATIRNASATPARARAWLMIEGQPAGPEIVRHLAAAGEPGDTAPMTFSHAMPLDGEPLRGGILLADTDALADDDGRYFNLDSGPPVRALVVTGPADGSLPPLLEPGAMLIAALTPYGDRTGPIRVSAKTAAGFTADDLRGVDAAFFCQAPRFDAAGARAIVEFVHAGGTAVLFPGPGMDIDNYHQRFIRDVPQAGGFLPAGIGPAISPSPEPVTTQWIDIHHPYFAGLHAQAADYPQLLVQRRFQLSPASSGGRTLIQLAGDAPLLTTKAFGRGVVVLAAVPDTRLWSDLPLSHLFLPMVTRMAMQARNSASNPTAYPSGAQVVIRPSEIDGLDASEAVLQVFPPSQGPRMDLRAAGDSDELQWVIDSAGPPGLTHWQIVGPGVADRPEWRGAFAVNAAATETDLQAYPIDALRTELAGRPGVTVVVADSLTGAEEQLAAQQKGRNWWDIIAVVAVGALIAEALAANIGSSRATGRREARAS